MIKVKTVGMIEKNAKNNPVVKAKQEMKNGCLHIVDKGEAKLPALGTNTLDLCVALNTGSGDNRYTDFNIAKDDFVNSYLLRAWDGQFLEFDESHITYGENEDYSSIVVNQTLLGAGIDGNFKILSSAPESGMYFKVVQKLQFNGNAVSVEIICK